MEEILEKQEPKIMIKTISYGFGKEYLKNWGIKEALREIYQNFIDYGAYVESVDHLNGIATITLINDYVPNKLEFLRIGNSQKNSNNAIGKHGEGLKMALLILKRENLDINIITKKHNIFPQFEIDEDIGEVFTIKYIEEYNLIDKFTVTFNCPSDIFNEFTNNIIIEDDIIFNYPSYGSIVNKEAGNIYSGGLFVCKLKNFTNAYDIIPSKMPLDRDRCVPQSFDVNYYSSKILEEYNIFETKDLGSNDTTYISRVPDSIKKEVKPIIVGRNIEFVDKDEKVIKSERATEVLRNDGFFSNIINKLKLQLVKHLGLYDLLLDFQSKHVHSTEAKEDFKIILNKVKIEEK